MHAADIRRRFRDYFVAHGHEAVPASSLVPADDPTLLFVNAGMVQFKRTFLGQDLRPYRRATSCQTCVRAGGKHNDLEQVGLTRRHHTFFEMLGNFSFGDYFKEEAIRFAWEFVTAPDQLGLSPEQLQVTVHHTDTEARGLWQQVSGLPAERIHGLGDHDNFWQMGDTGPCGPCSEIFVDLTWRPGMPAATVSREDFEAGTESGRFVEIWNLVFMQFDRGADGVLTPLPRPSVDTGAGLERITAVMQGVDDNFHTDLFLPLIRVVEALVGAPYPGGPEGTGLSYRVLADHARTVAFLLLDGVYPSNDGRGFVLRRILRRGVRHAWLLGRREPTLAELMPTVVATMGDAYPRLAEQINSITATVRQEEERFLMTIEAGMARLDDLLASGATQIPGDEAFKLFDTFGFPIDLTELIAAEQGVTVDLAGFDAAMTEQRERSRAARRTGASEGDGVTLVTGSSGSASEFVGYRTLATDTTPLSDAAAAAAGVLVLAASPFYATGGGQVADTGVVTGPGWRFVVADVRKSPTEGQHLLGTLEGEFAPGPVQATVDAERRRDIERNHSATHLLHLVLRRHLGTHVRQQGSLVEPGRLRFDFSHGGPIEADQLAAIEAEVNALIRANAMTDIREMPLEEALQLGAMAFFADKYGDRVRVVQLGDSIELCGGTHVASAGAIGLLRLTGQGGVAAGVRRIEAVTGAAAYGELVALDQRLQALAQQLKAAPDQIERKLEALHREREKLEARLAAALAGGGSQGEREVPLTGATLVVATTVQEARAQLGEAADTFRAERREGAILVLYNPTVPGAISVAVTDDLIARGRDANGLMKALATRFGGRGGGRPTFASGSLGVEDLAAILATDFPAAVQEWLSA